MFNEEVIKAAQKRLAKEKNKINLRNPKMIVYKIANKCNLSCDYCYFKPKDVFRKLTVEKFIDFIDYIAETTDGYLYIAFHGGEPFLEIDSMRSIVHEIYQKKYARRVRFTVQTNGTILDKTFFAYCKDKHITIGISIDGCNETTNACRLNNVNSQLYFEHINSTFNFLNCNSIEYSVISVLNNNNADNIVKFIDYLMESGVKSWSCNDLIVCDNIHNKSIVLTAEEKLEVYKKIIDSLIKRNRETHPFNRLYESNIRSWVRSFYEEDFYVFDICSSRPCGLFDYTLAVDYDGSIFPCDLVSFDAYRIGNIYDDNYINGFDLFKNQKKDLDRLCNNTKCNSCKAKSICKCNCKAVILSGINREHDLCKFFLPLYDYLYNILANKNIAELLSPSINIRNL
ncbi:MAG: radical SAM protein [Clostridia bacterium]|nr:radical SAM protein [Clostridia bacterium]